MSRLRRNPGLQRVLVFLGVALLSGLLWKVAAYDVYSDSSAPDGRGNCASCHELTSGGFQSRGLLHEAHLALATSTCRLCHTNTGDVPRLDSSGEAGGLGCIGCHGQPLAIGPSGAGLRLHHTRAGAPADQNGLRCVGCHDTDPAPAPESAVPAYYLRIDVIQKSPCNTDGKEDFWSRLTGQPDGRGLDNDGDLFYDATGDTDCGAPACVDRDQDGYGDPGASTCRNGAQRDCNDSRSDTYPGATEAFDQVDNNCNGETDEIEKLGFNDPVNRQRLTWNAQPPTGQLYDVIRSGSPQFEPANSLSSCLGQATPLAFLDDLVSVPARGALYYLVRNTLVSDYGKSSSGALRLHTLCP